MATKINLLPWRAALKKEREIRFAVITAICLGLTAAIFLGVHTYTAGLISYQQSRNDFLNAEIKKADKKIAEIKELEAERDRLYKRMDVIQKLQSSRPEIVHVFDELVNTLPEGVYYDSLEQKKDLITLDGFAQSSARVSSLMNRMDKSEWLTQPSLQVIERQDDSAKKSKKLSRFTLQVKQTSPKPKDEEEGMVPLTKPRQNTRGSTR